MHGSGPRHDVDGPPRAAGLEWIRLRFRAARGTRHRRRVTGDRGGEFRGVPAKAPEPPGRAACEEHAPLASTAVPRHREHRGPHQRGVPPGFGRCTVHTVTTARARPPGAG
ncbi:hypothetical protein GCM10010406_37330 [Streptomyces thermolineatus]|uniref:Uncharacterized protein n=1 Tax=Streptomyces thermolineatus TaxID=44033 RepID=A0ABP5ZFU7_9ACTN